MQIEFEFAETVERCAIGVAGVCWGTIVAGQLANLSQPVARVVMLVLHHADGVRHGPEWKHWWRFRLLQPSYCWKQNLLFFEHVRFQFTPQSSELVLNL